jgi:hypothetical protein
MTHRISRPLAGILALLLALTACGDDRQDRFASPGAPKTSPSGDFVAHVESASEVRVTDRDGGDVFRKSYGYATSQRADGIGVVWSSTKDQLWVVVPHDGTERIEPGPDGEWRATRDDLPSDITRLG